MPRRTCEFTLNPETDDEQPCGKPAVDQFADHWMCAEHFDLCMKAKKRFNEIRKDFLSEYGY